MNCYFCQEELDLTSQAIDHDHFKCMKCSNQCQGEVYTSFNHRIRETAFAHIYIPIVFWSATLFMDRAQKQATTLWYERSHNDHIILKVFDTILHITPFDIAHKLKTILVFS